MKTAKIINQLRYIWQDEDQRSRLALNLSLAGNVIYGFFKLLMGTLFASYWMIGLGVYYALLGLMRFILIRKLRDKNSDSLSAWKAYRVTAALLLALTLIITGLMIQVLKKGEYYDYPGVLIYAFACYAFVRIVSAIVQAIRKRKDDNRVMSAARFISLSGALMSILALQIALNHTFGENDTFTFWANILTGGAVCAVIIGISSYMIITASHAIENEGGGQLGG